MIVGHGPLAFVIVALACLATTTYSNKKILTIAGIAALASILPDIDVLFPIISTIAATPLSIQELTTQFWTTAGERHRAATHSLVVLGLATATAATYTQLTQHHQKLATILTTLAVFLLPFSLPVQLITTTVLWTLYVLTTRTKTLTTRETLTAFLFGVFIHPFGDMFTGTPPAFFYPFTDILGLSRWTISEPTIQFTSIFLLEIGSVIALLILLAHLTEFNWIDYTHVKPKPKHTVISTLALTVILAVFGLNTAPTVDSATFFVLPLVGITLVSTTPTLFKRQFVQYISDVSWSLFFAITTFTAFYTAINLV